MLVVIIFNLSDYIVNGYKPINQSRWLLIGFGDSPTKLFGADIIKILLVWVVKSFFSALTFQHPL